LHFSLSSFYAKKKWNMPTDQIYYSFLHKILLHSSHSTHDLSLISFHSISIMMCLQFFIFRFFHLVSAGGAMHLMSETFFVIGTHFLIFFSCFTAFSFMFVWYSIKINKIIILKWTNVCFYCFEYIFMDWFFLHPSVLWIFFYILFVSAKALKE
jgi:hypothetical protein